MVAALRRGGFDQWSAYAIGEDGFAVAARMEAIDDDGTPRPGGERWSARPAPRRFSLVDYLSALVTARTGRYRILVLLVTPRPVTFAASAGPEAVRALPVGGAGELSPELRARSVPPGRSCEALVYELRKAAADEPARVVDVGASPLTVTAHLSKAGLWRPEELR